MEHVFWIKYDPGYPEIFFQEWPMDKISRYILSGVEVHGIKCYLKIYFIRSRGIKHGRQPHSGWDIFYPRTWHVFLDLLRYPGYILSRFKFQDYCILSRIKVLGKIRIGCTSMQSFEGVPSSVCKSVQDPVPVPDKIKISESLRFKNWIIIPILAIFFLFFVIWIHLYIWESSSMSNHNWVDCEQILRLTPLIFRSRPILWPRPSWSWAWHPFVTFSFLWPLFWLLLPLLVQVSAVHSVCLSVCPSGFSNGQMDLT